MKTMNPRGKLQSCCAFQKTLRSLSNQRKAFVLQKFFKTGPGEYAEGDCFLGVQVPVLRALVKRSTGLPPEEIRKLIRSKFHEERLCALLILTYQYAHATSAQQEKIYNLYLASTRYINNWDLVDLTAPHIVGAFLWRKNKSILSKFSRSSSLWERRIAIVATFYFIRRNYFLPTLRIARELLADREDLIHKAVGWMLREVGKRDCRILGLFLRMHYLGIPRTTLRYAIEKFSPRERKRYLSGKFSN